MFIYHNPGLDLDTRDSIIQIVLYRHDLCILKSLYKQETQVEERCVSRSFVAFPCRNSTRQYDRWFNDANAGLICHKYTAEGRISTLF